LAEARAGACGALIATELMPIFDAACCRAILHVSWLRAYLIGLDCSSNNSPQEPGAFYSPGKLTTTLSLLQNDRAPDYDRNVARSRLAST
jgi:hypothetical protein